MSQATKRKHVVKELLGEPVVPSEQQQIVRVLRTPGNNLHEVETAQGQRFLVSMPSKYRKNIWIKRGDFLIVDPIEEGEKVKAEICFVLCKDHVRSLQREGRWPEAFSAVAEDHSNSRSSAAPLGVWEEQWKVAHVGVRMTPSPAAAAIWGVTRCLSLWL
ncbi:probable RNA-binding protein EIF1AD isoform X2 [Oryctolagus cuniculus]|uniref:probable RNA-binding protein EIF1AD isoform X2 n=1 Tax=Oryctolagus cuniculus TaxID=9986 RepID=UPI00222E5E6E|nr:probable RNA-binding protein EIF1AD isoform X2 [Oryctolagus cuniculus]